MARGSYAGPTEPIGLRGCFIVAPFYLFSVAFIIEDLGYGGAPGWQVLLAIVITSTVAFASARGIASMIDRIQHRRHDDE